MYGAGKDNSLWPSDAIWCHEPQSTLVQVITDGTKPLRSWASPLKIINSINHYKAIENYTFEIKATPPGDNELIECMLFINRMRINSLFMQIFCEKRHDLVNHHDKALLYTMSVFLQLKWGPLVTRTARNGQRNLVVVLQHRETLSWCYYTSKKQHETNMDRLSSSTYTL